MKITWHRIVKACLALPLFICLLTVGLVRCAGGGYVAGPERPPPYDDPGYGRDDYGGSVFDEDNEDRWGGGERDGGGERGEGEGADGD